MDKTYTLEELARLPYGTIIVCDSIPFTITGSFFTYENWEVQIIRNAIDFKKKYNKWPNFMTANPVTYDNCFAEVERIYKESMQRPCTEEALEEEFDWKAFDINKSIENYPLQTMPVKINDGLFITPLFSILWLDCKTYKEGLYKLSLGTNPEPDDGEDIEENYNSEPLQLRIAA